MRMKVQFIVVMICCLCIQKQSAAQKLTAITCYPGLQVSLDTTVWNPAYFTPVAADYFATYLPVIAKDNSGKELLLAQFKSKESISLLRLAFNEAYPKSAIGLIRLEPFNGFELFKNHVGNMWHALKRKSPTEVFLISYVAPIVKEKASLKEFKKILSTAAFPTLQELDALSGYPIMEKDKSNRSAYYDQRIDHENRVKNEVALLKLFYPDQAFSVYKKDKMEYEADFSFVSFEETIKRINNNEFTEDECLNLVFLPSESWTPRLYWDLYRKSSGFYRLKKDEAKDKFVQASERYAQLTGDTLSLRTKDYPKELPWKNLWDRDMGYIRDRGLFKLGRTADAIHFFNYQLDENGKWKKTHSEFKRPFVNIPYRDYFNTSGISSLIDPDLCMYKSPHKNSNKQDFSFIIPLKIHPDQLFLHQWPEYFIMSYSEGMKVSAYNYRLSDIPNKLYIFPVECRHWPFSLGARELLSDAICTEKDRAFNVIMTGAKSEPLSDSMLTREQVQNKLLKTKSVDRYYFTGIHTDDLDQDGDEEVWSAWYNNGRLILNDIVGLTDSITSNGYTRMMRSIEPLGLKESSELPSDPLFTKIMTSEEYKAFLKERESKRVIEVDVDAWPDEDAFPPVEAEPMLVEEDRGEEVFSFAHEMPVYPGGDEALKIEIQNSIRYPEMMAEMDIQGKVYLSFIVEKDGSISEVKVERGITGGKPLNDEAMRVIKSLKHRFSPARLNGKPVRLKMNIPVVFRLE